MTAHNAARFADQRVGRGDVPVLANAAVFVKRLKRAQAEKVRKKEERKERERMGA